MLKSRAQKKRSSVIGIMPQGELWEWVEIQGRFYEDVVSQDLDWHDFMWEPPPTSSHHETSRGPKKVENKNSGLAVIQVTIGAWAVILSWQCDFTLLRILGWHLFMKSQLSCGDCLENLTTSAPALLRMIETDWIISSCPSFTGVFAILFTKSLHSLFYMMTSGWAVTDRRM